PALQHRAMINNAEFSPDGTRVVTASEDGTAQVWDAATGQPVGPPFHHTDHVKNAHFNPAGDRVVTASSDGTARVWDAATGQPVSSPMRHADAVNDALFNPDGTMILTVGNDRVARLWDATTGQLLMPALHGPNRLWLAQFCPDGRHVLTDWCAYDKPALAQIWELTPPDARPVEQLTRLTELLSGRRLDADGGWMPLDAEALRSTWQELQAAAPADFALQSREEMLAWHRRQLADCERAAIWSAALFHLRWLMDAAPNDPTLYFRRGQALANLNRSTEALGAFSQAIEHKLPGPNAWQARGLAYVALGQWARAEADLTQAIQLKAAGATAWKWRGYVRAAQNDRSAALADVSQALTLDDDDDQLWDWRLLLLAQAGDQAGVHKTCAALLAHNATTGDANTANNTAWYCVRFGEAVSDPAVPLQLAQRAVAGKPATYAYVSTLGAALYRARRFTEAVTRLQQGIQLEGHGGGAADWFFLALAHHALGHAAEARRWYDQAVRWMQQHADDPKMIWRDRLEIDLLRAEVKRTLQAGK
ncbi:MAG TPA: tetratricopeptide repeat protein, partial [Gemmataceae bacterium]|nr:tetratricopeptide repeat protein [Gemmataceae bacterium]